MRLASMRALAYAASLQQPVLVLHVSPGETETRRFGEYWRQWVGHLPLEVVVSPYRVVVAPLVDHIEALHRQRPDLTLIVILPEIVVRRWSHRLLHGHTAARLRRAFRPFPRSSSRRCRSTSEGTRPTQEVRRAPSGRMERGGRHIRKNPRRTR